MPDQNLASQDNAPISSSPLQLVGVDMPRQQQASGTAPAMPNQYGTISPALQQRGYSNTPDTAAASLDLANKVIQQGANTQLDYQKQDQAYMNAGVQSLGQAALTASNSAGAINQADAQQSQLGWQGFGAIVQAGKDYANMSLQHEQVLAQQAATRQQMVNEQNLRVAEQNKQLAELTTQQKVAQFQLNSADQKVNAIKQLDDLQMTAGGQLDSIGASAYIGQAMNIIRQHPGLTPADAQELLAKAYQPVQDYQKYNLDKARDYATQINQQTRDTYVASVQAKIAGPLAMIKNGYLDSSAPLQAIANTVQEIGQNNQLDPLTKAMAVSQIFKSGLEAATGNATVQAELQHQQEASTQFLTIINNAQRWLANGKDDNGQPYTFQDYQNTASIAGQRLGVSSSLTGVQDPNANQKYLQSTLETRNSVNKAYEQGVIDQNAYKQQNTEITSALVQSMVLQPGAVANYETYAAHTGDPNVVAALQVHKTYQQLHERDQGLQQSLNDIDTQIQTTVSGSVQTILELTAKNKDFRNVIAQQSGIPLDSLNGTLTQPDIDRLTAARNRIVDALSGKKTTVAGQLADDQRILAGYGLDGSIDNIQKNFQVNSGKLKAYGQGYQGTPPPQKPTLGIRPNFSGGSTSPTPKYVVPPSPGRPVQLKSLNMATVNVDNNWATHGNGGQGYAGAIGKNIIVPFKAGAPISASSPFGEPNHGGHSHAGQDIAAPEGTPLIFYSQGTVKWAGDKNNGYGNSVEVVTPDGMLHRFGHMSSIAVHTGDTLQPGQFFGNVGHTGHAFGAHLHWEIRSNTGTTYDMDGTVNPFTYMASHSSVDSTMPQPRGGTVDANPNTFQQQPRVPDNALQIGGGYYLWQNKLYHSGTQDAPGYGMPAGSTASVSRPMSTGYGHSGGGMNGPDNNWGYTDMAQHPDWARATAQVANQLRFPAQWLADLMIKVEGSWNDGTVTNSSGYGGVIGFGEEDAVKMFHMSGLNQLLSLSPAQQMPYVYRYLNEVTDGGRLIKSPAHLAAAIFGGRPGLDRLIRNPGEAMAHLHDNAINLSTYLTRMSRNPRGESYTVNTPNPYRP